MPDVMDAARDLVKAASARERDLARRLAEQERTVDALALAAVEALEAVEGALRWTLPTLPPERREPLEASLRAAWRQLEQRGLARDGVAGEPLDLERHEVVKERASDAPGRTVHAVVTAGLTHHGRRLRAAAVVAAVGR